jgi:photosynthetic reaction center H subunit
VHNTGAVTGYLDVAQIVLYVFWLFFAGLIIYLRKEDKREGYPLESDRSGGRIKVQGFPAMPAAKSFKLAEGGLVIAPRPEQDLRPVQAAPLGSYLGAPLTPLGNPLRDAVGPASYAERANHPDYTLEGLPMIVPLRAAPGYEVAREDADPRGMTVLGGDLEPGGVIRDLWVDRAEPQVRYLELETGLGTRVLVPMTFAKIDARRRYVHVRSIMGSQFAGVPTLANPDQITRREEDRISAYYAGGTLYAEPKRAEPLL